MLATSFAPFKVLCSAYLSSVFYHSWETEALRCVLAEKCDWHATERLPAATALWEAMWLTAAAGAAAMSLVAGRVRQCLACALLVAWVTHVAFVSITPPHIAYVTHLLIVLAGAPREHDSASLSVNRPPQRHRQRVIEAALLFLLRASLAVGYGFSGVAKLRTLAWRDGWAFRAISPGWLRSGIPEWLFRLIEAGSVPLCAATLLIELGVPLAEAFALVTERGRPVTVPLPALLWLSWGASAALQMGILLLMPLTEVSVGMLLYHGALFYALEARCSRSEGANCAGGGAGAGGRDASDGAGSGWGMLAFLSWLTSCTVPGLLAYPSTMCFLVPSAPRITMAGSVWEALVKALLPLAKTTWDDWPCAPTFVFDRWQPERQELADLKVRGGARGVVGALLLAAAALIAARRMAPSHHPVYWVLRSARPPAQLLTPLWQPVVTVAVAVAAAMVAVSIAASHDGAAVEEASGVSGVGRAQPIGLEGGAAAAFDLTLGNDQDERHRFFDLRRLSVGGGHFWHAGMYQAVVQAEEGRADALALMLCDASPLRRHKLSAQLQREVGLPPDFRVIWLAVGRRGRFVCAEGRAAHGACETWCKHPCIELNGASLERECGACLPGSSLLCFPGADGYYPRGQRTIRG